MRPRAIAAKDTHSIRWARSVGIHISGIHVVHLIKNGLRQACALKQSEEIRLGAGSL